MSNIDVKVYKNILTANEAWADKTRTFLKEKNKFMINIIGSPGSGKTSLLESIFKLKDARLKCAVLEGDLETTNDADRIKIFNIPVAQLLTSGACHLEAKQIQDAISDLPLDKIDLVIVENVGNLVCPAEFDIGENAKIAVLSVTEGEDKPVKYPLLFREAKAVVLTKIDLLPYLPFNLEKCINYIKQVNSSIPIFKISSLKNQGINEFTDWLLELKKNL